MSLLTIDESETLEDAIRKLTPDELEHGRRLAEHCGLPKSQAPYLAIIHREVMARWDAEMAAELRKQGWRESDGGGSWV